MRRRDIGRDNGDVIVIARGMGAVVDIPVMSRDVCDVEGYGGAVENHQQIPVETALRPVDSCELTR